MEKKNENETQNVWMTSPSINEVLHKLFCLLDTTNTIIPVCGS